MNPSDSNREPDGSLPFPFRDISLESPFKVLQSRIELPREDPFSLKVIEELEKQGLFIRWRFGYRLANRYEVRRIHSGGMGIVWIVEDLFDNRKPYAAKSVKPFFRKPETEDEWERREKSIQRFLEECKIWVDLEKHRHIVHAEFLEKIEGVPLVMSEYIEGGDLTNRIEKGPLPIETVLDYAIQFCIGMEYANQKGVLVHRDIKPGNIMVTNDGALKVSDFGLTKAIREAEEIRKEDAALYEESQSPIEGAIISVSRGFGTPPYMAPEQFDERLLKYIGHPVYPINTACDIFAFGLVLYEMLKGKHAYWTEIGCDRETWDKAHRIASSVAFHPAYVYYFLKAINLNLSKPISDNEQLDNLILKCLKKNSEERYKDFKELKEELLKIFKIPLSPPLLKGDAGGLSYEVIEEPPQKPNYKNKGKTAFILGREEEAIKFYDKALEENPADTDVWLEKGLAMAEMGKLGEFGVCMEVIPYLKPSKEDVAKLHETRIMEPVFVSFSSRDNRLYEDIIKHSPCLEEFIGTLRNNEAANNSFKDYNPELTKLFGHFVEKEFGGTAEGGFYLAGALGRLNDISAIPFLIETYLSNSRSNDMRLLSIVALEQYKDISLKPFWINILRDSDARIRKIAIKKIGEFKDPLMEKIFQDASTDRDIGIRIEAARALGYIGKSRYAISVLIKAADATLNNQENEYAIAIEALGNIEDPSIIPILRAAAKKERKIKGEKYGEGAKYFRIFAEETLKRIGSPFFFTGISNSNTGTEWTTIHIRTKDTSTISALLVFLNHSDSYIRCAAARALGVLKDASSTSILIETFKKEDGYGQEAIIEALGNFKCLSLLPFFKDVLLKNSSLANQRAAIKALGKLRDLSVIPVFIEFLNDEKVRSKIAEKLDADSAGYFFADRMENIRIIWQALRYIWSGIEKEKTEALKHSLAPYSALEWNKKGLENLESGNKEEAIKCFEKAISIDPDWQEPRENLKRCNLGR